MAFPAAPVDGQVYKNYVWDLASGSWRLNTFTNLPQTTVTVVDANHTITGRDDARNIFMDPGASDRTVSISDTTGLIVGDRFKIVKTTADAGIVTFTGTDVEGYSGGVIIDSQYDFMTLEWNGTDFSLVEYKDHGSDSNGYWQRFADGTMRQSGETIDGTTGTVTSTYPKTFVSISSGAISAERESADAVDDFYTIRGDLSTMLSSIELHRALYDGTWGTSCRWIVEGRWRP